MDLERQTGLSFNYHLFPKALGQILHHYNVEELHLSLTQGRWQYIKWGYPELPSYHDYVGWSSDNLAGQESPPFLHQRVHAAPVGAEIWAWLRGENGTMPCKEQMDDWDGLLSSLAGIFCSSLNQVDRTQSSTPLQAFPRTSTPPSVSPNVFLRYAALPREVVCTENLTPWAKLLPCRKESGLATLLNSLRLYDMHYHSLAAQVTSELDGWQLVLTLDVVTNHHLREGGRTEEYAGSIHNHSWSLSSIFDVAGASSLAGCPVSFRSAVLLQPPRGAELILPGQPITKGPKMWTSSDQPISSLVLSASPDLVLRKIEDPAQALLFFDITPGPQHRRLSLNVEFTPPAEFFSSDSCFSSSCSSSSLTSLTSLPVVEVHRYQTGRGQIHAELNVDLVNSDSTQSFTILYYDSLPWFLKPYWHTLRITQNGTALDLNELPFFSFSPATHQGPPSQLELQLVLPPSSTTRVVMRMEKLFLLIDQYPPDVSRGFDIQAAVVTILAPPSYAHIRLYSEQFLVLLPFPDMSMPFNVIAFTSTVLAFFFGSMFNMLYKTPKEILARSQGGSPLTKVFASCQNFCNRILTKCYKTKIADRTQ
eukprot:gb/GEZN01005440.1/.p1 GENE.gb/GEZN01005440.1/~~gb/GEZN01005440.1/.p1  ORF type:complete len:592 (-),score=69.06 gb/GEZN01005440.1/:29-1804(-)